MSTDAKMQDLHVHTHLSDGLSSPAEVVRAAAALGIARLAITDHDCLDAHLDPEAKGAALALGIELVTGLELDCTHQGKELEVLGYGFNPEDEALGRRLRQVQTDRRRRFAFLCEGMAARGEPVRPEGILANATLVP
ncbi:MAG: PHP domain-containing protein, partial [Polyangia bacterium]|nr:PHP domain-containing protein [Polyangia bacterium]